MEWTSDRFQHRMFLPKKIPGGATVNLIQLERRHCMNNILLDLVLPFIHLSVITLHCSFNFPVLAAAMVAQAVKHPEKGPFRRFN